MMTYNYLYTCRVTLTLSLLMTSMALKTAWHLMILYAVATGTLLPVLACMVLKKGVPLIA